MTYLTFGLMEADGLICSLLKSHEDVRSHAELGNKFLSGLTWHCTFQLSTIIQVLVISQSASLGKCLWQVLFFVFLAVLLLFFLGI